jgi:hypothetical protein
MIFFGHCGSVAASPFRSARKSVASVVIVVFGSVSSMSI